MLQLHLFRYACPDLTELPGFFAKALPEAAAKVGNVLYFQIHPNGEVHYGVNNQDRGLFLPGMVTDIPLWPVVDIYGNTLAMEFVGTRHNCCTFCLESQPIVLVTGPCMI